MSWVLQSTKLLRLNEKHISNSTSFSFNGIKPLLMCLQVEQGVLAMLFYQQNKQT